MEAAQKNAISYRARALQKLRAYLHALGEGEGDLLIPPYHSQSRVRMRLIE